MKKQAYVQLKPYLLPGEQLLWCGRPATGFRITEKTVVIGVVASIFTCVWFMVVPDAVADGKWFVALLVTIPCSLLWLAAISDELALRRAAYGVTHKRVIVSDSLPGRADKSIPYRNLHSVMLSGSRTFGTIRCSRASMSWKNQDKAGRMSHPALFRRIADAGTVCDLILEQCARANEARQGLAR